MPTKARHDGLQNKRPSTLTIRALMIEHRRIAEPFLVRRAAKSPGLKADRRAMLRHFTSTGSYVETARKCGVTTDRVRQLMLAAVRHLRERGKLPSM